MAPNKLHTSGVKRLVSRSHSRSHANLGSSSSSSVGSEKQQKNKEETRHKKQQKIQVRHAEIYMTPQLKDLNCMPPLLPPVPWLMLWYYNIYHLDVWQHKRNTYFSVRCNLSQLTEAQKVVYEF